MTKPNWRVDRIHRDVEHALEDLSKLDKATIRLILDIASSPSVIEGEFESDQATVDGMPRSSLSAAPALAKERKCSACHGKGTAKNGRWCPQCHGTGHVYVELEPAVGLRTLPDDPLKRKKGHGFAGSSTESAVLSRTCTVCEGKGSIRVESRLMRCKGCDGTGLRNLDDPISSLANEMFAAVGEVARLTREVSRRLQVIQHVRQRRPRESTLQGNCIIEACGAWVAGNARERLIRGYCPACYVAWTAFKELGAPTGDPGMDKDLFRRARTLQLEGIAKVVAAGQDPRSNEITLKVAVEQLREPLRYSRQGET